jgi:glycosyltransferase involved in cell wall biosynthesis
MEWYQPFSYLTHRHSRIDRVICLSEKVRQSMLAGRFFDSKKLVTIHKGQDPKWYENTPMVAIKKEMGLSDQDLLLVAVANNRPVKGMQYLFQAMEQLPPHIHLLVIGQGYDTSYTANKRIHYLGFQERPLPYVRSSDAFVMPSIKEGLGKATLEAMMLGVPCVVTADTGSEELVRHEQEGLVVQAGDSGELIKAIHDLDTRREAIKEMGQKAQRRALDQFSIRATADAYEVLYTRLINASTAK